MKGKLEEIVTSRKPNISYEILSRKIWEETVGQVGSQMKKKPPTTNLGPQTY